MSVTTRTQITCIDLHQTGSVGAASDHLQLTKFWRSCAPGKGSAAGRKFLAHAFASLCAFSLYIENSLTEFITQ